MTAVKHCFDVCVVAEKQTLFSRTRAKSLHQEESCWLHEELPIFLWWSCMPHLVVRVASRTLTVRYVDDSNLYDP